MNLINQKNDLVFNSKLKKRLAVFYSKPAISDLLSSLIIKSSNSIILDPSCGSGTLLKSAFNILLELENFKVSKSLIIGIEIFHQAWKEAHLLENNENTNIKINILHGDAFFLKDKLNLLLTQYSKIKNIFDDSHEFIILANPPFSKAQNLPLLYKKEIVKTLSLKKFISLGLHCYFLILINKILPNKGKFAIILPLSFSYVNRGSEIIRKILLISKIEYIIISEAETSFSIGSNFQEIILIGTKNEKENNLLNKVKIINLKIEIQNENVSEIKNHIIDSNKIKKNHFFTYYSILQEELINKIGFEGWNFLYRTENLNSLVKDISRLLIPIKYEKNILKKRGINLPADFFFIPNKYYQIKAITNSSIQLILKNKFRSSFDTKYSTIIFPKKTLMQLIRKPELYKTCPLIRNNENFCLKLDKNSAQEPEISHYLHFGIKIGANKRSNTSILGENWFQIQKMDSNLGDLFLTFKWDPRYRSFLMNYSQSRSNVASQAFWIFKINNQSEELKHFFLSWFNSTLNMAILFNSADVQRRVWRQLSGNRIDSLLIVPFHYIKELSIEEIRKFEKFNNKKFDISLLNELDRSMDALEINNYDNDDRVQIDLIFLNLLIHKTQIDYLLILKELYSGLKDELIKITKIN